MSCPYLAEITMSLCRAYPVKKPVPTDRLDGASPCGGEGWNCCPVYREALRVASASHEASKPFHAESKGGKS